MSGRSKRKGVGERERVERMGENEKKGGGKRGWKVCMKRMNLIQMAYFGPKLGPPST